MKPRRGIGVTEVVRAAVLALAAVVFWWPLTVTAGVAAGGIAGAVASLAADRAVRATRPPLRLASVLLLCLATLVFGLRVAGWLGESGTLVSLSGAVGAIHLGEVLRCALCSGAFVFALRFVAARHPALAPLEIAVVAGGFVTAVSAHREGMIHRPLPLGDLAWSNGLDPSTLLLALGVGAALLLAALLLREERRGRVALHLGAAALLVLALVVGVRLSGLPTPRPPQELGLTQSEEEGGESQRTGNRQSTDLDFRDDYRSDGGRAPVAVVVLHDDYAPPAGAYYFRQTAYSEYNGRRLVRATGRDIDEDIVPHFPSAPLEMPEPPQGAAREELRTTTGVLIEHVKPFALDSPVSLAPKAREDPRFRRVYEAVSQVQVAPLDTLFGRDGGDAAWSDAERDHYTRLPEDARYAELAEEVLATLKPDYREDPLGKALAVKLYLDQEGTYSLRNQHSGSDDPVASFLFGDRTGYCVHFAHAAVYLMRALGVPARVAAGYAVPEGDRGAGSTIMIRGLNAHAWPELYLDGVGWVVVDLSPERVLDQLAAQPDPTLQMMLGQMLRDGTRESQRETAPPRIELADVARALAALAALAAAAGFAVKAWRRLAPRLADEGDLARVAYRDALDRLAGVGMTRGFGEGRERFGARVAEAAPTFAPLTRTHVAAAFAGLLPGDPRTLRRSGANVQRELRSSVPLWRRLLAALDPTSWMRSR